MPTAERAIDAGTFRAESHVGDIGVEFRERRLGLAQSQEQVASSCHLSRGRYRLIERGKATNLTVLELDRIAAFSAWTRSSGCIPVACRFVTRVNPAV